MDYDENSHNNNTNHDDQFRKNRPWNRMAQFFEKLYHNENNVENENVQYEINSIPNEENSVYCFFGNRTLHAVNKIHNMQLLRSFEN